jgi:hypothetical protein
MFRLLVLRCLWLGRGEQLYQFRLEGGERGGGSEGEGGEGGEEGEGGVGGESRCLSRVSALEP